MKNFPLYCVLGSFLLVMSSCKQNLSEAAVPNKDTFIDSADAPPPPPPPPPKNNEGITYRIAYKKEWKLPEDSFAGHAHKELLAALNRVDVAHLKRLDSFIVPNDYSREMNDYLPFPKQADYLQDVEKLIIFSYPTQTLAAYENGKLVLTGPTNMGKKSSETPTGLFFCNWKSKESVSTVDEEWILKWNFNVSNFGGVGFHQYAMPGYPASHSCMRLWMEHAQFLYGWAEQWKLSKNDQVLAKGTPVIIYGEYPFGEARPWYAQAHDPLALEISVEALQEIVAPHKEAIMQAQAKRQELVKASADTTVSNIQ